MAVPVLSPIAKGETDICIEPSMANRHGLIAGSTGTGKTVTLRVLIEHFSSMGSRCLYLTSKETCQDCADRGRK
jgi:DNA helicase HerA-like ATPase